jgi:flagellar L-ring protein FlgH
MVNHAKWLVLAAALAGAAAIAHGAAGAPGTDAPSSSLLVQPPPAEPDERAREEPHALRQMSMFAVAPPTPRTFQKHDLVQVIVREQSQARSSQELDTKKDYKLNGRVSAFPRLTLPELLELQIPAGRTSGLPAVGVQMKKDFKGDGDYTRRDDLSARITAEVIEVLPNGNLIIEARTHIAIDREQMTMKVTGVCRPDDVTAANTVLSSQLHNLVIERVHRGDLRETADKGIIARILDTVFAF